MNKKIKIYLWTTKYNICKTFLYISNIKNRFKRKNKYMLKINW